MHCIFVGAQSLFLKSLIQDTSADLCVLDTGLLGIRGSAEAVVMARSHIQQFVKLFENNENLPNSQKESEVKREFKQFVEARADNYTMDLLILPTSLKKELLTLTQVSSLQEYIKGICEPELEERECYPKAMHCIFVGAQSLFLKSLIQDTSADLCVLDTGLLGIRGSAEAVVMARSHIQQFVKLFENNENLPNSQKESEVKREFKQFVEARADNYTMDLLILPTSLKKELLTLTQGEENLFDTGDDDVIEVGDSKQTEFTQSAATGQNISRDEVVLQEDGRNKAGTPVSELTKQMDTVFSSSQDVLFVPINGLTPDEEALCKGRVCHKRRFSDSEERHTKKQFSLENVQEGELFHDGKTSAGSAVIDLSGSSDAENFSPDVKDTTEEMEYNILVNFFKTMGYSQEIVEKVIREYGPSTEPLLLLEEIEKENKRFQEDREFSPGNVYPETSKTKNKGVCSSINELTVDSTPKKTQTHTQQNMVAKFPQLPFKGESKPCTSNCKINSFRTGPAEQKQDIRGSNQIYSSKTDLETDGLPPSIAPSSPKEVVGFVSRGASGHQPRIPLFPENGLQQQGEPLLPNNMKSVCENRSGCGSSAQAKPNCPALSQTPVPPPQLLPSVSDARSAGPSDAIDSSVTGVQRFRDTLKVPYKLELKNEPGRMDLKHIVIDGSNVAITHGLKKFFSCRGIAIAVEYFWKLGNRNITVFVPQWRTRRDPNVTEQHFLTQLQELGILSLTPARMVFGERIASHDDRYGRSFFFLRRWLCSWTAALRGSLLGSGATGSIFSSVAVILCRRLLQYTFVGDIFMVPDDPLGRSGPRLEEFLRKEVFLRDMQPLLNALPSVGMFDPGFRGPGPQAAGSSHQPPARVQGPPPSHWLPQQPRFPLLPGLAGLPQGLPAPAQRSCAETSELREALLKIFPDSEQRLKIDQILVAHPYMKDLNALSAMVLD
ncbi:NEDD4-binding protein 1 [Pteropus vampyrus]|uniref:NEDD4-binding protein 1 n=1 Tax=Pteropus vampyrus TaxID=132908 RepID=A0A6P6BZ99_PTEVA|nr:NEDD4-binding protein 1 [Pteropus vampyrus]